MKIRCKKCSHSEETNIDFFVKVIGGTAPVGGFWAWVTYFFAGTGFAAAICTAMVVGGVGLLVFKNEVVEFISNKYACPKCGAHAWEAKE